MAPPRHRWLAPALRRQALVSSLVITGFIALAVGGMTFDLKWQIGVLIAGVVLVGFPHGAFDHLVAGPILAPRWGRFWWAPFGLAYLALTGAVMAAWAAAPLLTLAVFLAGSMLHFGLGDSEDELARRSSPRWVAVLTYGALPILLPLAFHPAEAAPTLAALGGVSVPDMASGLSQTIWATPIWAAAFVWLHRGGGWRRPGSAVMAVSAAGFVVLPPLLAFGLYFGAVHSLRHLLRLAAWRAPFAPLRAARWALGVVAPASVICAIGGVGLAILAGEGLTGLLTPLFRILAALTLPHMIVTSWLRPAKDQADDDAEQVPTPNSFY